MANTKASTFKIVKILLDAIDDEFTGVRIKVFSILTNLSKYFVLKRIPDIDSVVHNLLDSEEELRGAVYNFLKHVRIEYATHVFKIIKVLLEQLQIYPEDKYIIFNVCKELGKNNQYKFSQLIKKLLPVD